MDNCDNCPIKRFIQKARTIRIPHDHSKDAALLCEYQQALRSLLCSVEDIGRFSLLIQAIRLVAHRTLKHTLQDVYIRRQRQGEHGEGLSGDTVFFVYNKQGERLLVIKAYCIESERFEQAFYEVLGIAMLKELDLSHVNSVSVQAVLRCCVRNKHYLIVAQTLATGCDIDWYIEALFKSKRKSAIKTLTQQLSTCMELLGKSLAELHQAYACTEQSKNNSINFSWYYREHYKNNLDIFTKATDTGALKVYFENAPIKVSVSEAMHKIQEVFYRSLEYCVACHNTCDKGLFHGDVWFSNILFDKSSNKITLIDSAGIARSVDKDNAPWGLPGYDYTLIVHNLELKACFAPNNYYKKLLNDLIECFYHAYKAAGGRLPSLSAAQFYRLTMALEYCGWFACFLNQSSVKNGTKSRKFMKSLVQCNFDHIIFLIAHAYR